jgi:hypothetical protein
MDLTVYRILTVREGLFYVKGSRVLSYKEKKDERAYR